MSIQSPLANMIDIISEVINSAERYKDTLSKNEAATRAVLIDPVLRSLGWDISNPFMVEIEKVSDKSRVDYALSDENANIRIIIEAKALGTNLDKSEVILALVNYAFTFGIQDILLTDGIIWTHYYQFSPGKVETKAKNFNIDPLVDCSAFLIQILDAAKYWQRRPDIDMLSSQVDSIRTELAAVKSELNLIQGQLNNGTADEQDKFEFGDFFELTDLNNITGLKPTKLRLPNNKIIQVDTWRDILVHCVSLALENNKIIPIPYPDRAGKKVDLLGYIKPAKHIGYFETNYNNKVIYVYTNYDSNNCVSNALHILKLLPKDQNLVSPAVCIENRAK